MVFASLSIPIIACYGLGSLGFFFGLSPRGLSVRKAATWCIGAGFALHTLLVLLFFFFFKLPEMSKGIFLQIMAWSLIFVYCVTWWRLRFPMLGVFAGPLAILLVFLSDWANCVDAGLPETLTTAFFIFHLTVHFFNLGLITLGFGSALYFLNLHRKLKNKSLAMTLDSNLPALATVDRINALVVLVGFPLFTVGLLTGFAGAHLVRGHMLSSDPKEIVSILIWLVYIFIFIQRAVFAWRGKKAALMLVFLFVSTLASLLGVNFFMDSHHNFFQARFF